MTDKVLEKNNRERKSFLLKFYILGFLDNFSLLYSYLIVILNETLTPFQVSVSIATYSGTSVLLEIPTAGLADRFGQKNSLLIGQLFVIFSIFIFVFRQDFISMLLVNFLFGVRDTLFSGTNDSLYYNNMKHLKIEKDYSIYVGKSRFISSIGFATSAFLASFVVKFYNYQTLKIVQLSIFIFYFFILLTLSDYKIHNEKLKKLSNNYKKIMKNALGYLYKNSSLLNLYVFFAIAKSIQMFLFEYNGFFYGEITGKPELIGILLGIDNIINGLLSYIFIKKYGNIKMINLLRIFVLSGIFIFLSVYTYNFPTSYILFIGFWITWQISTNYLSSKLHKNTPSKIRSTVVSVSGFIASLVYTVTLFIFGFLAEKYNYKVAFISVISFYSISTLLYYIIIRGDKHSIKK